MIASGEKTEEYREIKAFWWNRLVQAGTTVVVNKEDGIQMLPLDQWEMKECQKWDIVRFRNGYSNGCPTMDIEWKDTIIGRGEPSLGAPSKPVFIIKLGKILSITNYNPKEP